MARPDRRTSAARWCTISAKCSVRASLCDHPLWQGLKSSWRITLCHYLFEILRSLVSSHNKSFLFSTEKFQLLKSNYLDFKQNIQFFKIISLLLIALSLSLSLFSRRKNKFLRQGSSDTKSFLYEIVLSWFRQMNIHSHSYFGIALDYTKDW